MARIFKKNDEVSQEQAEGVADQVLAAMENHDKGKVAAPAPVYVSVPTDEELAEQQERLEMDRKKQMTWQTALVLYPSILSGVCANPNVPDNVSAKVAMGILQDALGYLQEFGDNL